MQQFTVPQFIDVEDKIIGAVTVRQFVIMIVAVFFLFLEYKLSDFTFFIFIGIITLLCFGVLAFVKINGMPFHYFILNFIQTFKKPKVRIWDRFYDKDDPMKKHKMITTLSVQAHKAPLNRSHLSEIALVVDTGGAYQNLDKNEETFFNQ